jgi:hypothetical protein
LNVDSVLQPVVQSRVGRLEHVGPGPMPGPAPTSGTHSPLTQLLPAPHEVAVHEHAAPHVGSQSVCAFGSHVPSEAHVPAHVYVAHSGQHSGCGLPERYQHCELGPHSVFEPPIAHAPDAFVMHTP